MNAETRELVFELNEKLNGLQGVLFNSESTETQEVERLVNELDNDCIVDDELRQSINGFNDCLIQDFQIYEIGEIEADIKLDYFKDGELTDNDLSLINVYNSEQIDLLKEAVKKAIDIEVANFIGNVEFEDVEDISECLDTNGSNVIDSVVIGFYSEESQARAYLRNDVYPDTAWLFDLEKGNSEDPRLKGKYLLQIVHESEERSDYIVYDNLDDAKSALSKLEGTKEPDLNDVLDNFNKMTNNEFDIRVKSEFNNSGNSISFNIYYYEDLIYDGAFDLTEDLAKELLEIKEFLNQDINGFKIGSIKKVSGQPSWEKSYEIELSKGSYTTTQEISLNTYVQGQPRNVIDVIEDEIDWDALEEESQNEMRGE